MAQKKKGSGKPRKKTAGRKPARKPKKKSARKTSRKTPAVRTAKKVGRKKPARKKASAKKAPRKATRKAAGKAKKKPARRPTPRRKAAAQPARGKAATKRAAGRDSAFFEHFRQKLLEQRLQITSRLDELREELRGLEETPRELEEWAQEEKDRDILIRLEDRETDELRKIQAALGLIDRKEYGYCQICGKPIPRARLEELPTAFRCVDCTP
jgi:DnaK suppressor protein